MCVCALVLFSQYYTCSTNMRCLLADGDCLIFAPLHAAESHGDRVSRTKQFSKLLTNVRCNRGRDLDRRRMRRARNVLVSQEMLRKTRERQVLTRISARSATERKSLTASNLTLLYPSLFSLRAQLFLSLFPLSFSRSACLALIARANVSRGNNKRSI